MGELFVWNKAGPTLFKCVGVASDIPNKEVVILTASVDYGVFQFLKRASRVLLIETYRATSLDNKS